MTIPMAGTEAARRFLPTEGFAGSGESPEALGFEKRPTPLA